MSGGFTQVATGDGRTLEVLTAGDPDGYPWLWISGTPSAAVPFARFDDLARRLNLRMLAWSRPGYGGSAPRPSSETGPRIADDVPDIETILDALDVDEFITVGWSGGGPRALACAALLPDRCRAAATWAGVAPSDAKGLDWLAGMAPENVEDFTTAREGREAYAAFQERFFLPLAEASVDDIVAGFGELLTPLDASAVSGDVAEWMTAMMHRAGEQGVVGVCDDGLAIVAPWGFDVGSIEVPVAVWAGRQDAMVPLAHGQWLADHIPGVKAHLFEDEGHVTLVSRLEEMLVELRTLSGR